MLAKDLISDVVPALKTSDSGVKALYWMDIFRISHLPIVNSNSFLGLISDKDIYDINMADEPIGNHKLSLFSPFVYDYQHIYEVIEVVARLKLSVVPVLNDGKEYLGLITINDLIQYFSELMSMQHAGGIIVLEVNANNYSLTQIANLVESNDIKILSLYAKPIPDSTMLEITLKLNTTEIASVIRTFERYDYYIKASYMEDDNLTDMYQNRYDSFMKYLSI
jgi:acetoin utilization protein AcuB